MPLESSPLVWTMQETTTLVTLKCQKCGKVIRASTEDDAKKMLTAHDEEMHEPTALVGCNK
jgi:hypothetical protein